MRIHSASIEFDSGMISMANQKNDSNRYGHIVERNAGLSLSVTRLGNSGTGFNKQIVPKEYSVAERKIRAAAFIERSGRLKFYIGLIQLKEVT